MNKFNKIQSLGYIPSDFCMDKSDIINTNHDDRFDYILEHMYHIDTQDRGTHLRVQGFITPNDFYIGIEELVKAHNFYIQYIKGYIKLTFELRVK